MGNFRQDRNRNDRSDNRGFRGRDSSRSGGYSGGNRNSGGRDSGRRGYGGGNRNSSRDSGRGGFGRERPQMHDVICDKCKKDCQVPFRPSGGKPVLCSDCFGNERGEDRSRGNSGSGVSQEQFKQINEKLDKILTILEQVTEEVEYDDEESEDSE